MNKIIVVIAIVFAFTLGTIFSADIATAVKPVTEVLVTNTEPISVTGIVSSTTQPVAMGIGGIMKLDGCTSIDGLGVQWFGTSPAPFNSGFNGWVTQVEMTETSFVAKGFYDALIPGCAIGSRDLPHVFTFTGDCGEGVIIDITTDGGTSGTITGNVACVP